MTIQQEGEQRLQTLFGASMWESWKAGHPIRWRWWAVCRQIERPLIWIQRRGSR